ncbi:MAG: hypothetical protein Q8L71_07665 [Thiobacillus sp.]|nr:hypothetical protein [Thiobacillus sp.]
MKSAIAFITLALLAAPAWAYHQDSDPDLKQSITNVHENHFPHIAGDSHDPERGDGDMYGSILLDIQAGERHVPHKSGDNHSSEEGSGDFYRSVLNN